MLQKLYSMHLTSMLLKLNYIPVSTLPICLRQIIAEHNSIKHDKKIHNRIHFIQISKDILHVTVQVLKESTSLKITPNIRSLLILKLTPNIYSRFILKLTPNIR
jgi:hypothetical protein